MLRIGYRPAWLVIAVWALMAGATLWMVRRCALSSPYADELRYVGVITGAEPLSWKWFFQVENQHCAPLFKLAYLAVGWTTGFDFCAGACASALLLVALSLAMVLVAARIRGRASELDVIFPLLLLHWGHYVNLIWGFQLFYVLPTVLAATVLLIAAASGPRLSIPAALGTGACLAAAGLSGGPGVFYVPPLAAWLAYAGIQRWRKPDHRACREGVATIFLAIVSLLPLLVYVADPSQTLRRPAPIQGAGQGPLAGALAFLGLGVGKIGKELWPISGAVVLGLVVLALHTLYLRWRREPAQRIAAAGLGLFLCGGVLLALGTGMARAHMAPRACLQYRYMLLATPLVLGLYWIAVRFGPAADRRAMRLGSAALMIGLAVWYNARGWNMALGMRAPVIAMEEAVAAGLSPREVAIRFAEALQDPADSLAAHLEMLRGAGLGPYRTAGITSAQRAAVPQTPRLSVAPQTDVAARLDHHAPDAR